MAIIRRFVPEVTYENIGSARVRFEIDTFDSGTTRLTHYSDSTKYVELQKKVYVLENVIGKIAKAVAKANFVSSNGSDKVVKILNNPNKKQSKEEFLKEFTVFVKAAGWMVMWKRYGSFGVFETLELLNLDPDKTSFATNGSILSEYEGNEVKIEPRDCIVFYDSIKDKDGKGYSKIKPLKSHVDNCLAAQIALGIQIDNSGTTIVSPKVGSSANGMDEGLDKFVGPDIPGQITQKQQIEDKLNSRGLVNRIIVANRGIQSQNLSSELNSFDFLMKIEPNVLAIADAFGVPVELTPYGKTSTYDNKGEAELSLMENEAAPLVNSLTRSLNQDLGGKAEGDFSHIGAMSIVEKRVQESNGTAINQYAQLLQLQLIDKEQVQRKLQAKGIIE